MRFKTEKDGNQEEETQVPEGHRATSRSQSRANLCIPEREHSGTRTATMVRAPGMANRRAVRSEGLHDAIPSANAGLIEHSAGQPTMAIRLSWIVAIDRVVNCVKSLR